MRLRACLAGLLSAPALALAEELCKTFFWRNCFLVKSREVGTVLEEPLERSRAKHPLNNESLEQLVCAWIRRTPHESGGIHFRLLVEETVDACKILNERG